MKLVSFMSGREVFSYATDLTPMDFTRWATAHLGRGSLVFMTDITPPEFQRWQAEGYHTILRRDAGL
jgi:hypothetical protein